MIEKLINECTDYDFKEKFESNRTRSWLKSVSVVINALYHQIIYTKSVPFSIALPSGIPTLNEMDTEAFNNMMATGLKQAENGEGIDLKTAFDKIK